MKKLITLTLLSISLTALADVNPKIMSFTTFLPGKNNCPPALKKFITEGNSFAVTFNMAQAPSKPGKNGLVTLMNKPDQNFQPNGSLILDNEGLQNELAFMSDGTYSFKVNGQSYTARQISLQSAPMPNIRNYNAYIVLAEPYDNCIIKGYDTLN